MQKWQYFDSWMPAGFFIDGVRRFKSFCFVLYLPSRLSERGSLLYLTNIASNLQLNWQGNVSLLILPGDQSCRLHEQLSNVFPKAGLYWLLHCHSIGFGFIGICSGNPPCVCRCGSWWASTFWFWSVPMGAISRREFPGGRWASLAAR